MAIPRQHQGADEDESEIPESRRVVAQHARAHERVLQVQRVQATHSGADRSR